MSTPPRRRVGLYFGSFNPIHIGHLIIAEYVHADADLQEVWLVVSPQNPHKRKESLLPEYDRLHLCRLAIGSDPRLQVSDVEFDMPKPSYTVDTLGRLVAQHPDTEFQLIMGADNLETLPRWKNHQALLEHYPIVVYPRYGAQVPLVPYPRVRLVDAPLIELASTRIRERIQAGLPVQYMLPAAVWQYIDEMNLYRRSAISTK